MSADVFGEPVELRCPVQRKRLLAKLFADSGRAVVEIACKPCTENAGRGATVVHRFSTADGELVATITTPNNYRPSRG